MFLRCRLTNTEMVLKIGTLTRDFQLKVVDCPKMNAPKILFKPKGSSTFYNSNQIITVKDGDPNCFEVMVTDPIDQ